MGNLTGRTALVTGASRGIGRAIAVRLAADGARVAVHYGHDEAAAKETVELAGGGAFAIGAEFGPDSAVDELFGALEEHLAGKPLDILVNNAAAGPDGSMEDTTPAQFDRLFAINVKAPFFVTRRALPLLRDGGRVITLSSACTRIATPHQTSFAMSKAAIEVLGMTLANAVGARGITINTVLPGATDTEVNSALLATPGVTEQIASMTALGRVGAADDIADAVAFLSSDDARWITGQVLDVSGGMYLGPR
ncbi:SDR family NAD(P)-dependent oxidoreductase [Amycolatopsis minnesotensis]|uniref:SDR family oxidoreductase n=1 Tax=Amycolatopsis minnesotensis TaxID=337894 RepID=A0ABP5D1U8_9PSEU